ncbi:MAG: histidine phosphatase family protein [Burkholderiaceae bacterium]|nr:histidine phosphatase family protein [Burkholderiaceae bacterium]
MPIILIRHGETPLNAARVVQPPDTPLSDRGRAQARAVAVRVEAMKIVGILSSDLARAAQTAAPISERTGLPVVSTELLRERNFGDLRGMAYDAIGFDPLGLDVEPPNGESWSVFRQRVAQAFDCILSHRADQEGSLAVVTHGLVIRALVENHLRLPSGMAVPERLANTSVTVFAPNEPYAIQTLNCHRHLDADNTDDGRGLSGL